MIWKKQPVGSKLVDLQNNKAEKNEATQNAAGLMSASDKTKLDGITQCEYLSTIGSLNQLKTSLQNVVDSMEAGDFCPIRFYTSSTEDIEYFKKSTRYLGVLFLYAKTPDRYVVNLISTNGHEILVSNDNGTWYFNSLIDNTVKITDRVLIDRNTSSTLLDCDDVTQAGIYRMISSTANRPSNISYGVLVHLMSNDYVVQFVIGTNGVFASRGRSGGSWGSWQ